MGEGSVPLFNHSNHSFRRTVVGLGGSAVQLNLEVILDRVKQWFELSIAEDLTNSETVLVVKVE